MKHKKYNHYEGNKSLKTSIIPKDYLENVCYSNDSEGITECIYYITPDCPGECDMVKRIMEGISHSGKTGIERFKLRYGEDWRMIVDGRG